MTENLLLSCLFLLGAAWGWEKKTKNGKPSKIGCLRSSREPALCAPSPAAQVVRFDKARKEANGLQPLASFF